MALENVKPFFQGVVEIEPDGAGGRVLRRRTSCIFQSGVAI
jgi:hypothetical protein